MLAFVDVPVNARKLGTKPAAESSVSVITLTRGPILLPGVAVQANSLGSRATVVVALAPPADLRVNVSPGFMLAKRLSVFDPLRSTLPDASALTSPTTKGCPPAGVNSRSKSSLGFQPVPVRRVVIIALLAF